MKCDLKNAIQIYFLQKLFEWFIFVIMLDHFIVSFFDRLVSLLMSDVCLFSICRTMYARFRFFDRRLWWDVKLDEAFYQNKTTHQTWRKRLIKFDEKNLISSKLTKTLFHQTWDRHFIKFLKRKTIFLFFDELSHATTHDVKNLVLQKIIFVLCENKCCVKMLLW
jgi:hypothetical protein